jgi:exosortase
VAGPLAYLYYPVFVDLAAQWSIDTTYGYGYYIPFVALYLAWDRRRAIMAEGDAPGAGGLGSAWIGYLVLLIGLGAYLAGLAGGVQLALRVSLIVVLFGLAIYLGGWRVARVLAFPIAFLAVMIPPPAAILQQLTWPLQLFTARFSTEALQLLGYPVLLRGIYIDLPTVRVEVAEACSGFRSLIALAATGVLMAYLTQRKPLNRLLLVAAVIPIAIIANAVRVTWIIVMGARDPRFFDGPLHPGSGMVVFILATALMIGLATVLARRPWPSAPRMSGEPA